MSSNAKRELLRLAWPAVVSYILHNAYRVNDQLWIQGLGGAAQAAVGTSFFVLVLNFSLVFLAAGGALALVSRALGAGDRARMDSVTRHALLFGTVVGVVVGAIGATFSREIAGLLGLDPATTELADDYLATLYLLMVPMALVPVLDNVFIGRGRTQIPMRLDVLAIVLNYVMNPILIYGGTAVETLGADGAPPGAGLADGIADALGLEPLGIRGAALATGLSRTVTSLLGILILRVGFEVRLFGSGRPRPALIGAIARISAPVSVSIAVFSGVYLAVFALVMRDLDTAVKGGLGVGFQVFEGVAFPCYLGVGIAGASLVGRRLGAGDEAGALAVVRDARFLGRVVGIAMTVIFLGPSRFVVPWFTQDPAVEVETLRYVTALAFSQYFVGVETVNEKVLLGAGHTRPIVWIAGLGNGLRIPLAWFLATFLGLGAIGVWWAINTTTYLKAGLYFAVVERRRWLR